MIELREYQKTAVKKMLWSTQIEGASLVVLPQGSGKSIVIADFVQQWGKPTLILVPSKELLEQDMDKLSQYVDSSEIAVFSASMNSKKVGTFTFATIQSAHKDPSLFKGFEMVIIDEAHLVNPTNYEGMFNRLFDGMGNPKVIGLTASPFRMSHYYNRYDSGKFSIETVHCTKMINRLKERFWHQLIYVQQIEDLIGEGFLCPLTYIDHTLINQEVIPTNKSKSDFNMEAFEALISEKERSIAEGINAMQPLHKSVLVFASSVAQANRLAQATGADVVFGETPKKERERVVIGFKDGSIKTVINVGVLNTGFDHPQLDCIVLARPTRSLSLHVQMLGRGTRIAEGKTQCQVIDYVGNTRFLGRAETMRVEKNEGKWDVSTNAGWWHQRELYKFKLRQKEPVGYKELLSEYDGLL